MFVSPAGPVEVCACVSVSECVLGVLAAVVLLGSRLDGFWGKTLSSACQHAGSAFVAAAAGELYSLHNIIKTQKEHGYSHNMWDIVAEQFLLYTIQSQNKV